MSDDEDEGISRGIYECGHWVWDENVQELIFISDLPPELVETVQITSKAPTGIIEFRETIDLIEQVRYRRRYQRKIIAGDAEVVTLQDVKDIAIYTAPISILSPMLINMLHSPTTERFLRALVFCCAYYLQIADEMADRILELESKVRTPNCELLENQYKENLSDLRLLVAKEYCIMLLGGGDMKKFHHMGFNKKRRSLSDKDAKLFETFIRISVQIVYLALGRRAFSQIELECHRIFKSDIFNSVEHTMKTGYLKKMVPEERTVLLGSCLQHDKKLNTRSPAMNEIFCHRPINYRLMGLGVIKFPKYSSRQKYLRLVVCGSDKELVQDKITLGIIGMNRASFDTMLYPINQSVGDKSKSSASMPSSLKMQSKSVTRKSTQQVLQRFYPLIEIPTKTMEEEQLPPHFPQEPDDVPQISEVQRRRWQNRFRRMMQTSSRPR